MMHEEQGEHPSALDAIEQEIREIAQVLLHEHPPGTPMIEVWDEAQTLYRVRFETEVLPPPPSTP